MKEMDNFKEIIKQAKIDFDNLRRKSWREVETSLKNYTQHDARFEFFVNYTALNIWLLIHLDTFSEMIDPKDNKIAKYVKLDEVGKFQYLRQHDQTNRTTYVTKAMFNVEDFIKKITKEVQPTSEKSYWNISQECLECLNMLDDQKMKILNAPYKIRNTLHNNGFHYDKYDFEITLRGKNYKFVNGDRVYFAGWDDLYIFFDELLTLLIEIVNNPVVKKVKLIPQTSHLD